MALHRHQKAYEKRQKNKKGLIQVTVWVPESEREVLLATAKMMRNLKKKDRTVNS